MDNVIPTFFDDYHLPPGEHACSIEDIESRFLGNEVRVRRWNNFVSMIKRMLELKLVPETVLINGSFVTGRKEPGDVDFAFLIEPDTIREALKTTDDHDQEAVKMFLSNKIQSELRNLFGAHLLVAPNDEVLEGWSKLFRYGQFGQLRDPDPTKDPDWVKRPKEKGILKLQKSDIINGIGGA